jgi:mannose-6-phosphate isomerase-like protein (cupin superfamily)
VSAIVLSAGEGETITEKDERSVVIKAEHELLDLTEARYAPGEQGPAPHVHRRHADAFYVLEGELVFRLGPDGERLQAPAGTLVLVPENVIHSFANEGDADAHYLNAHAPSMGFADSLRVRRSSTRSTRLLTAVDRSRKSSSAAPARATRCRQARAARCSRPRYRTGTAPSR